MAAPSDSNDEDARDGSYEEVLTGRPYDAPAPRFVSDHLCATDLLCAMPIAMSYRPERAKRPAVDRLSDTQKRDCPAT